MKIAIVYNHDFRNVINLFGLPNKEKIGRSTIKRITDALKAGGHQIKAIEGDKDLISRLEEFMPRVLKGEQPGLVFNLSYGIQGQARRTSTEHFENGLYTSQNSRYSASELPRPVQRR